MQKQPLYIFGVNPEGFYVRVGCITIDDSGEFTFGDGTPILVREEITDGIDFPTPFTGRGLFARIAWLLNPPTIKVKPDNPLFTKALERRNTTQFVISHQGNPETDILKMV